MEAPEGGAKLQSLGREAVRSAPGHASMHVVIPCMWCFRACGASVRGWPAAVTV